MNLLIPRNKGFNTFIKTERGFTLIELLIAITIIALLSAIGFVAYSYVMKQGRDSKRQSDLRSIQSALEQYNSDQGFYPYTTDTPPCGTPGSLGNGLDKLLTSAILTPTSFGYLTSKTYINSLPQDPTGTLRYRYQAVPADSCPGTSPCNNSTNKCTSYCLYAKLENPNPDASTTPSPTGPCTDINYNFVLTPP